MNDDFLYELREQPPPAFARRLKARLDEQDTGRGPMRSRYLRGIGVALLLGGTAYAISTGSLKLFWATELDPPVETTMPAGTAAPSTAVTPRASPQFVAERAGVETAEAAATTPDNAPAEPRVGGRASNDGAAAPQPPTRTEAAQRGGPLGNALTIVGTPGTEPHTEQVLELLARERPPAPAVTIESVGNAAARACDVTRGAVDVLVTFSSLPRAAWEPCASLERAIGRASVEIVVGYEAVVIARSVLYGRAELPARTVFLALARDVPDPRGLPVLVPNPYRAWYEIDSSVPEYIRVVGPPQGSPAARAFAELVLEPGCAVVPAVAEIVRADSERVPEICRALRADGLYTEYSAPGVAVRGTEINPDLFVVLSGDEFMRGRDRLAAAAFDGVAPSLQTLADGTYPASRTLYIYTSRGGGTSARAELVETYMRLPEIARVLVAPDGAIRREMWSRTGFLSRSALFGDIR